MKKLLCAAGTIISILLLTCTVFGADYATGALVDGRAMVPVRGVFEYFDFDIVWDADTQTAILADDTYTIKIQKGQNYFTVNGNIITPDVPQQVIDGSLYLPLRAIGDSVGAEINWNSYTKQAMIIYEGDSVIINCNDNTNTNTNLTVDEILAEIQASTNNQFNIDNQDDYIFIVECYYITLDELLDEVEYGDEWYGTQYFAEIMDNLFDFDKIIDTSAEKQLVAEMKTALLYTAGIKELYLNMKDTPLIPSVAVDKYIEQINNCYLAAVEVLKIIPIMPSIDDIRDFNNSLEEEYDTTVEQSINLMKIYGY